VAIGCQQYRVCDTGRCPVGITTQDAELRARLEPEKSADRLANFLRVVTAELASFARLTGRSNVHALDLSDLRTTDREIARYTDIAHVGESEELN
jgi:glutamate synthase domain-containing protein 2